MKLRGGNFSHTLSNVAWEEFKTKKIDTQVNTFIIY